MNKEIKKISLIIPTYNGRQGVNDLTHHLADTLNQKEWEYELIFIDDHSTDGTVDYLNSIKEEFPIKTFTKIGEKGKAFSFLEGFQQAQGDVIAMIDADLQYPPDVIPTMIKGLDKFDIVVANRRYQNHPLFRKILSNCFKFFFGKALFQSGLKVFKKQVLHNLELNSASGGLDYGFLFKAKRMHWKIGILDVVIQERRSGINIANSLLTGVELVLGAIKLRLQYLIKDVFKFLDHPHHSERYPIHFNNPLDFLFIPEIFSIKKHLYLETISLLVFVSLLAISLVWMFKIVFSAPILIIVSGMISLFYLGLMIFKLIVVFQSLKKPLISFTKEEISAIKDEDLPIYTLLIPLCKEAEVIPQIIKAMTAIDYPHDKLDVIITLEEYDHETIEAIKRQSPPPILQDINSS